MIAFTVPGVAQPKGSTRLLGRHITADNKHSKPWQRSIAWTARQTIGARPALTGPISLSLYFYFQKPPSARGRQWPIVKPDLDKLIRCACDALTGIVYADDNQVVAIQASKYYASPARTEFVIRPIEERFPEASHAKENTRMRIPVP